MTIEDRAASRVLEMRLEERGMAKAELARRSGISTRTIFYYLQGERAMTLGTFRLLCDILELPRQEAADRVARQLVTLEDTQE